MIDVKRVHIHTALTGRKQQDTVKQASRGIGQVQHHPQTFSQQSLDFKTIRSTDMNNDCMLSFTF